MPVHSQPHVVHRRVRLIASDPHPALGADAIAHWWGRVIELGRPRTPKREQACRTLYIWPIVGPSALLSELAKLRRGAWVCEHQFRDLEPGEAKQLHTMGSVPRRLLPQDKYLDIFSE